jgi:hypothetical protein
MEQNKLTNIYLISTQCWIHAWINLSNRSKYSETFADKNDTLFFHSKSCIQFSEDSHGKTDMFAEGTATLPSTLGWFW